MLLNKLLFSINLSYLNIHFQICRRKEVKLGWGELLHHQKMHTHLMVNQPQWKRWWRLCSLNCLKPIHITSWTMKKYYPTLIFFLNLLCVNGIIYLIFFQIQEICTSSNKKSWAILCDIAGCLQVFKIHYHFIRDSFLHLPIIIGFKIWRGEHEGERFIDQLWRNKNKEENTGERTWNRSGVQTVYLWNYIKYCCF